MSKQLIFIQSHPIQYNAPFFRFITLKGIESQVLYCSQEGFKVSLDRQFGKKIQWDIPLLEGYKYEFVKNNSPFPSIHNGFFGLLNFQLFNKLKSAPKSIVVVHGWNYASSWLAILASKYYGHKVAIRGEAPQNQEYIKKGIKKIVRNFFLKNVLFSIADYFLYIGTQNKIFYENLGVDKKKMMFMPYCVDNQRFQEASIFCKLNKDVLKKDLSLNLNDTIILYSGKYILKKRPLDLLKAFNNLKNKENVKLIMMGDGVLRSEMENYIQENNLLQKVILTGFINQSEISRYYGVADIFVMPSDSETLGHIFFP
jgi:glycosyltransferase involved in cell wall biosynthesis